MSLSMPERRLCSVQQSPPAVWVRGRAQHVHGSAGDLQDEEHVDPLERHRAVHMEEVTRQHRRRLGAQKLPPGRVGAPDRRWRYPQPPQDAANRRRSHAVAEFEQLALDPLVSPALILSGHALDQHGHSVLVGRTSDTVGIGPFFGDHATVPGQQRGGGADPMQAESTGE
jgi:hypothetical protein